jgi:hypothetical protein
MAHWTKQITEAYRMMLEAKEAPAHHKDPHYLAMVQHNAKMHELVGGGGKVTKEHIATAEKIISAAHEAGHSDFQHGGSYGTNAGKIGFMVMGQHNIHSGNPGYDMDDTSDYFKPVDHSTSARGWNSTKD